MADDASGDDSGDDSGADSPPPPPDWGDDADDSSSPTESTDSGANTDWGDDADDSSSPTESTDAAAGTDFGPSGGSDAESDVDAATGSSNLALAGAATDASVGMATVGGSNLPDAGSAGGAIASGAGGAIGAGGMAASVVSATIQCIDEPFPPIVFSYNPSDYKEIFEGNWKGSLQPATQGPVPQWQGVTPQKVTVKILLDEFAVPPPVMPLQLVVRQLKQMVLPTALSLGDGSATAPMVMFMWGDNIILDQAYIRSVKVTYQRFFLGNPVRAEADVELSQIPFPTPLGATNPTSGGVATRKTRTLVAGDSLPSIAFQEYKDPNKWRALAEANGIDDPMRVKMGTVIAVPDRREAENLS